MPNIHSFIVFFLGTSTPSTSEVQPEVIAYDPSTQKTCFQCEVCLNLFDSMVVFKGHPCVEEKEKKIEAAAEEGNCQSNWNRDSTLLLINDYKQQEHNINSGKLRKKALWGKISVSLSEHGYVFSPDQVAGRWKSLVRAYKNTKDHNNKSGNDLKVYEYEKELNDIFSENPSIQPTFTLSSAPSSSKRVVPGEGDDETDSNESSSTPVPTKKAKKATERNEVISVFKNFVEEQKEEWKRREAVQREKIAVMSSLVAALKGDGKKCKQQRTCFLFLICISMLLTLETVPGTTS